MGIKEGLYRFGRDLHALSLNVRGFIPVGAIDNNGRLFDSLGFDDDSDGRGDLFDQVSEIIPRKGNEYMKVLFYNGYDYRTLVVRNLKG